MIRIAKKTRLKPPDVIGRASEYFGEGGEGLEEKERNPCCISFEGAGGYVAVSVVDDINIQRSISKPGNSTIRSSAFWKRFKFFYGIFAMAAG